MAVTVKELRRFVAKVKERVGDDGVILLSGETLEVEGTECWLFLFLGEEKEEEVK
jgi:hypothetical protein